MISAPLDGVLGQLAREAVLVSEAELRCSVDLLPRCYQTIPHHADPSRTPSVPSVEIL